MICCCIVFIRPARQFLLIRNDFVTNTPLEALKVYYLCLKYELNRSLTVGVGVGVGVGVDRGVATPRCLKY
jgi:hypothetical protein